MPRLDAVDGKGDAFEFAAVGRAEQVDDERIARDDAAHHGAAHHGDRRQRRIGKADFFDPGRRTRSRGAAPAGDVIPRTTVTRSAKPVPKLTISVRPVAGPRAGPGAGPGAGSGDAGLRGPRITRTGARRGSAKCTVSVLRVAPGARPGSGRALPAAARPAPAPVAASPVTGSPASADPAPHASATAAKSPARPAVIPRLPLLIPRKPYAAANPLLSLCPTRRRGKHLGRGEAAVTRCGTPPLGRAPQPVIPQSPESPP